MKNIKFIGVLFFAIATACSEQSRSQSAMNANMAGTGIIQDSANESGTGSGRGSGGGGGRDENQLVAQKISLEQADQNQSLPIAAERKIIRNADLSLETDAPQDAQNKITAIAEGKGGFVIESAQSGSDSKAATLDTVSMTVRVPAAKFSEALDEIRKTSSRTITETVKGQDVTEEFIDIEARLKTHKALEAQFLEIMKRSNSVEDALNVQREIADVRGEIEKIEGRRKFLENQSSLSTIKVKLQTPAVFSTNSSGFFAQIKQSFGRGFDAALSFILVLITMVIALLPFLIFVVLPIYLLIRYFLKKSRKQKLAHDIAREEIRSE